MPVDGLDFRDEGPRDAPALVLIPSLGSTMAIWDGLMPALTERFRVVRFDLWGHGASAVPDGPARVDALGAGVLDVMDELGVEASHVAGTSLGGMVALWLGIHHPTRVRGLVLVCTSARLANRGSFTERAERVRCRGMQAVATAVVDRWLTPEYAARHAAAVQALRSVMVEGVRPAGYAACCEAIASWDCMDDLAGITTPTLVVVGTEDTGISPTHGHILAESIAGARLASLHAAHLPSLECPAALARLICAHLEPGSKPASVEADWHADDSSLEERRRRGERTRRAVLGGAHVDRAQAGTTPFTAPFQDLVQWYAWGSIWSRGGISRRERSMITLALLTALDHDAELAMHVRGALRLGIGPRQIQEVLLHAGVYAGIPAANRAFAIAAKIVATGEGSDPGAHGAW